MKRTIRSMLTERPSKDGTLYSFEMIEGAKVVWSGRDFISAQSRADAMDVAQRALNGLPPRTKALHAA